MMLRVSSSPERLPLSAKADLDPVYKRSKTWLRWTNDYFGGLSLILEDIKRELTRLF